MCPEVRISTRRYGRGRSTFQVGTIRPRYERPSITDYPGLITDHGARNIIAAVRRQIERPREG